MTSIQCVLLLNHLSIPAHIIIIARNTSCHGFTIETISIAAWLFFLSSHKYLVLRVRFMSNLFSSLYLLILSSIWRKLWSQHIHVSSLRLSIIWAQSFVPFNSIIFGGGDMLTDSANPLKIPKRSISMKYLCNSLPKSLRMPLILNSFNDLNFVFKLSVWNYFYGLFYLDMKGISVNRIIDE